MRALIPRPKTRLGRVAVRVLIFLVALLPAWFVTFELAIWLVPNRTPEGYGLMPIGQAAFSLLAAPVVAALLAWLSGRGW
jgi:hypothetical protein